LFSACGRNSFLIKKRYSNGFYTSRSNKVKTEPITFLSYKHNAVQEHIIIAKPEKGITACNLNSKPTFIKTTHSFKTLKPLVQYTDHFIATPTKTTKEKKKISYNNNDLNSHFFSGITIVLALAMIVALTKIFGLMFTIAVCFIIAFTAISIFFIIRTHLN
jgi:hypothetical protein